MQKKIKLISLIKSNDTLKEMATGIGIWGALWFIGILIYRKTIIYNLLGLLIGLALSLFYLINLYGSIESSLELDEKGAMSFARNRYLIRYLVVAAVFVLTALSGIGSLPCCFAGIFGIKISAFLQPLVRRYVYRITDPPGQPLLEDEEEKNIRKEVRK
ncbi:MAG: hypothetical protein K5931_11465 [Lachnospiraceae bacterium]|nr:hypothetical protein [Lachnospiraceae bacterium]